MSSNIPTPDHVWELDSTMTAEEYVDLLDQEMTLKRVDGADFLIRSVAGHGSRYDIVELVQETKGLLGQKREVFVHFKYHHSDKTAIAEDVLNPYKIADVHSEGSSSPNNVPN
ncbi:hypothetical protein [Halorubrum lipolyticum]|uniref:hypothetical protein n=1 Tax=Halorubrum lipolyticum TaxID=368624 RepID=UPI0011CB0AB2|nr:hypothetical protein [Halorubrum lipolyticum]